MNEDIVNTCVRIPAAFAAMLLSGLAFLGVPSAAADEQLPTPAETSEGSAPAEETVAAPNPEPSDVPTSEEGTPEAAESVAPREAADPPPPADETDDVQAGEEGESTGAAGDGVTSSADEAAAAEDGRDPRATIGDINCTNLTVPVTLDNSRSTEAVLYEVGALGGFDLETTIFEETVRVPARASRLVDVPVTEDTFVMVDVFEKPLFSTLARAFVMVDCAADDDPEDPQARIGGVDCARMAVDVTLDNSRSEIEITYIVTLSLAIEDEPFDYQQFNVPAGDVRTVLMPVTENSAVEVFVGHGAEEVFLVDELFRVDCTPGDEPRASIGEVSCTNLTLPVTVDNSRSPVETLFGIVATTEDEDGFDEITYYDYLSVAAGTGRVVSVPVPNNAEVTVTVDDANVEGLGAPLADEIFEVGCERTVAVRGFRSGRAGALAATGANGLALPIAGLTLLAGGGVLTLLGRRPG
jgi:hypothetical protein